MPDKNVFVKITGGLGNQMFQYASSFALARHLNKKLILDTTFYHGQNLRAYELEDIFHLSNTSTNLENINQSFWGINTPILRRFVRNLNAYLPLSWRKIYEEPYYGYHSDLFELKPPCMLVGYWQSPKYFEEVRNEILNEFKLKRSLETVFNSTLEKLKSTNSVSVHIRRGDYVSDPSANQAHGLCSMDYYKTGLNHIAQQSNSNIEVFVFSDDVEWCKQNLNFGYPLNFVENLPGKNTETDLYLMSQCRHNVIANSSYSWWGAWLNQSPNKIVVAPQKWFNDPKLSNPDIYPKDWIKI